MGRSAELADVRRHVAHFGDRAMLTTIGADDAPHVVSTVVDTGGDALRVRAGPRSAANVADHPAVTLVWQAVEGGEYALIVDGTGAAEGPADSNGVVSIAIDVTGGILHRLADLPGDAPSCIALTD